MNSITDKKIIRALLVDSDPRVTNEITSHFTRNGVVLKTAGTLAEARTVLRQNPTAVDVVILELCFPDGRGESLLPDIEICSRQPAVIITSYSLPDLQAVALQYRPVAISKPVNPNASRLSI